jgi:hypothetical protein
MYVGFSGNSGIRTRVAMGTVAYIRTELLGQVQVRIGLTGDVNRWSADLWAEDISKDSLRIGFLFCMVIGGQGCPQILVKLYSLRGQVVSSNSVIFVLVGRDGFALRISEFEKVA